MNAKRHVGVVVGSAAPQVEQYAASQLCGYLEKLFDIQTEPSTSIPPDSDYLILVGNPSTNPAVEEATGRNPFPKIGDQGLVLRHTLHQECPALIVGGGSARATMWAVYELVERWGVRYLQHRDVLPENREPFELPELDVVIEPTLPVRYGWGIIDFAGGYESWGMRDYRPVIDQLAKLKINRLLIVVFAWQPFLDYEVSGIKRESAWLWYDYHYPITADMVGRELFGDAREFWNPDLPMDAGYQEFTAAGEQLVHNLIDYAHQRGLECVLQANLLEFPPEFKPLLKGAQKVQQLGELTIVPGADTDLDDPGLVELGSAVLRATVNTYPEADFVALWMQEHRQWTEKTYEGAWSALDAKYDLSQIRALDDVLARAGNRTAHTGGAERAVREVKGDITALYFYDRLLTDLDVLNGTRRPDMKFIYGALAEEMYPLLPRLIPQGGETLNFIDYTPSRVLNRREVLKDLPCREIPCSLIYTLDDDNIGVVPQLTTPSLHELTRDLIKYGCAGFEMRQRYLGDHDPAVAYLAKVAWDASATPDEVYRDQIRAVCGEGCVEEMLTAFHEVEAVTVNLEWKNLSFSFPVPGMMMKFWKPGPMSADLIEDRAGYRRALEAARQAQEKATTSGRPYVDYWVGRLQFAAGYLDAVEAVTLAATAEAANNPGQTLEYTQAALGMARQSIEAYARVAQDQTDRGTIAVLNEYVFRPLKAKVAELRK
ncbi:MAG: hypothetical protein V1800_09750 [Candidatus Latescibacterota bacterium]